MERDEFCCVLPTDATLLTPLLRMMVAYCFVLPVPVPVPIPVPFSVLFSVPVGEVPKCLLPGVWMKTLSDRCTLLSRRRSPDALEHSFTDAVIDHLAEVRDQTGGKWTLNAQGSHNITPRHVASHQASSHHIASRHVTSWCHISPFGFQSSLRKVETSPAVYQVSTFHR